LSADFAKGLNQTQLDAILSIRDEHGGAVNNYIDTSSDQAAKKSLDEYAKREANKKRTNKFSSLLGMTETEPETLSDNIAQTASSVNTLNNAIQEFSLGELTPDSMAELSGKFA